MAYTDNLIPTMTSNTAPYGIASASTENTSTTHPAEFLESMATIAGYVVGHRLAVEVTMQNIKIAGYALQVEFLEPVAATSRYKLFDGSTWVVYPLKRYNGAWNDVSNLTKWYNGSWQT